MNPRQKGLRGLINKPTNTTSNSSLFDHFDERIMYRFTTMQDNPIEMGEVPRLNTRKSLNIFAKAWSPLLRITPKIDKKN